MCINRTIITAAGTGSVLGLILKLLAQALASGCHCSDLLGFARERYSLEILVGGLDRTVRLDL